MVAISSLNAIKMAYSRLKSRIADCEVTEDDRTILLQCLLALLVAFVPVLIASFTPGPMPPVDKEGFEKIYSQTTHLPADPYFTHNMERRNKFYFLYAPNSTDVSNLFHAALQQWIAKQPRKANVSLRVEGFDSEAELLDGSRKVPFGITVVGTVVKMLWPDVLDYKIRFRVCKDDLFKTNIKFEYTMKPAGLSPYMEVPFLSWQTAVEQSFITRQRNVSPGKVSVRRFPHPIQDRQFLFKQAADLVAIMFICSCMLPMICYMKQMVDGKRKLLVHPSVTYNDIECFIFGKTHRYLLLMVLLCCVSTIMYLVPLSNNVRILHHTDPIVLMAILMLYALDILFVTLFITVVFQKLFHNLVTFLLVVNIPFPLIQHSFFPWGNSELIDRTLEETTGLQQLLLCMHPNGAFQMAMRIISSLEKSDLRATWSTLMFVPKGGYKWNLLVTMGCMATFFLIQFALVKLVLAYPYKIAPWVDAIREKLCCYKENVSEEEEYEDENVVQVAPRKPVDMPSRVEHWARRFFGRCRDNNFHIYAAISRITIPLTVLYVAFSMLPRCFITEYNFAPVSIDFHAVSDQVDLVYEPDQSLDRFFGGSYLPLMRERGVKVFRPKKDIQQFLVNEAIRDLDRYVEAYAFGISGNNRNLTAWYNGDARHALPLSLNLLHTAILRNLTGHKRSSIRLTNHPLPYLRDFRSSNAEEVTVVTSVLSVAIPVAFAFVAASYVTDPVLHPLFAKIKVIVRGRTISLYWAGVYFWHMFCHFVMCVVLPMPSLLFGMLTGIKILDIDNAIAMLVLMFGCSTFPIGYMLTHKMKMVQMRYGIIVFLTIVTGVGLSTVSPMMRTLAPDRFVSSILNMFPIYAFTMGMIKTVKRAFSMTICSRISRDVLDAYCQEIKLACPLQACCNSNGTIVDSAPSVTLWREDGCGEELFFLFFTGILYFAIFFCYEGGVFNIFFKPRVNETRRKEMVKITLDQVPT